MRVRNTDGVTASALVKFAPAVSSAESVYFTELSNGEYHIARANKASDPPSEEIVKTNVYNPYLCDISPDSSELLLRSVGDGAFDGYGTLWIQPLTPGKLAHSLNISAFDGTWSRDASEIVYARGPELRLRTLQTGEDHRIASVDGFAWWPRWSPDGKVLRFTVTDAKSQDTSIWETKRDGTGLHRLNLDRITGAPIGCGTWSRSGELFVFQSGFRTGTTNLWAVKNTMRLLADSTPTQLTTGPISFRGAAFDLSDDHAVFVRGQIGRGQIERLGGRAPIEITPGIYSETADISPDGKTIAFTTNYPRPGLFASTLGQTPVSLTSPGVQAAFPRWSRDGTRLAISLRSHQSAWQISVYDPKAGSLESITPVNLNALHASWSPDRTKIMFGTIPTVDSPDLVGIYTQDLLTKHLEKIAGSEHLFTPNWSPDGSMIVALDSDSSALKLYRSKEQSWETLTTNPATYPIWSAESSAVLFATHVGGEYVVKKIFVATHQEETILRKELFQTQYRWLGLHPDGTLLRCSRSQLAGDLSSFTDSF